MVKIKEHDNLKKLKSNLIKNGKKKYKAEIKIMNDAMKKLKKQKEEIERLENNKQKNLFGDIYV